MHPEFPFAAFYLLVLGLALSLLAWPARGRQSGRRALLAIWAAVAAGSLLVFRVGPLQGFLDVGQDMAKMLGPDVTVLDKGFYVLWNLLCVNAGLRLLDLLIWDFLLGKLEERPVSRLLVDVLHVLTLTIAALWLVQRVSGTDVTTIVVTSTVATAAVGLAMQDVLRSVVAGIVMQMEGSFSLGEWVRVADHEGRITQMNWRTVTLRTRENHHVILSNSNVAGQEIINFSRPARLQAVDKYVGVAYAHPPEQVKAVLKAAVVDVPGVRLTPAPRIYTKSYDDFAITYRIRFWIVDYGALREIEDGVMTRVWYALKRAGMTIPFPIRDVNLRAIPEDQAEREAAMLRERRIQALRPLDLLAPLDDDQIAHLADGARLLRFADGEILMREKEEGDSLVLVLSGTLRIDVSRPDGEAVTVAQRGLGEIVGEMSLLTGEPRSATVVAEGEVEVLMVNKACFAGVLLTDPSVAEALANVLAERSLEQDERLSAAAAARAKQSLRNELLARVRKFFSVPIQ